MVKQPKGVFVDLNTLTALLAKGKKKKRRRRNLKKNDLTAQSGLISRSAYNTLTDRERLGIPYRQQALYNQGSFNRQGDKYDVALSAQKRLDEIQRKYMDGITIGKEDPSIKIDFIQLPTDREDKGTQILGSGLLRADKDNKVINAFSRNIQDPREVVIEPIVNTADIQSQFVSPTKRTYIKSGKYAKPKITDNFQNTQFQEDQQSLSNVLSGIDN